MQNRHEKYSSGLKGPQDTLVGREVKEKIFNINFVREEQIDCQKLHLSTWSMSCVYRHSNSLHSANSMETPVISDSWL